MENTYTFSRALHMMRYGGAKMRCLECCESYFMVVANHILRSSKINGVWSIAQPVQGVPSEYIMGSWVEVAG